MRLIDLRCDWALQYAAETCQYDPAEYAEIPGRLARLDGYLMGTALAVLGARRTPAEWSRQADPRRTLLEMLARHEAEFSGRLLARPDDAARLREEPDGSLAWGVLAVDGLGRFVASPDDLDFLDVLFRRGVRVFRPFEPGRDGLGDLDRAILGRLLDLAPAEGPRPILDLAGADAPTLAAALDWIEADADRPTRLLLLHSRAGAEPIEADHLRRLRALGATIGVVPGASAEAFREAIDAVVAHPFRGREGHEGVGVATDYLGVEAVAPELADVEKLEAWLVASFPPDVAPLLIAGNARSLLLAAAGCPEAPRSA